MRTPAFMKWAPRVSATYDLFGDHKTVVKASWGRYLDQINTGTPPNANGNISQTYVWNDTNSDLVFQPGTLTWDGTKYVGGELGTLSTTSIPNPAAFDTSLKRPKRYELTAGIDREIILHFHHHLRGGPRPHKRRAQIFVREPWSPSPVTPQVTGRWVEADTWPPHDRRENPRRPKAEQDEVDDTDVGGDVGMTARVRAVQARALAVPSAAGVATRIRSIRRSGSAAPHKSWSPTVKAPR